MSDLTAVNLFAGIEGFGLALHHAGIRTVAAVEIDPAARGVIADHFPETTLFNDVTEVDPDAIRATGFVSGRGVLTAGWPCQGLSVAGLRLGLGDARSGLFEHLVRLVAGLRPRWLLLENVPGLLSAVCPCPGGDARVCDGTCDGPHQFPGGACGPGHCMDIHGGAMGTVLGALAGLGYGLAYRVLDAQYFGVPQRRRRVVIVGCLGDWAAPAEVLLEPESGGGNPPTSRTAGPGSAASAGRRADGTRQVVSTLQSGGSGIRGYRIDAEAAADGQLVPVAAALTARYGKGADSSATATLIPAAAQRTTHALTSEGADASEDGTGRGTPLVPVAFQCHGSNVGEMGTLRSSSESASSGIPCIGAGQAVRRLTPVECERLQGFPSNWTVTSNGRPQADSARYRQLGNSIAVPVFEWVAKRLAEVDARLI
jgi:DNA (cytosine-5)-methyltransferase 1